MQLETLFENNDYIIVNKPSGLLSIPDRFNQALPNVKTILSNRFEQILTLHRLDKFTSGCICFAKNEEAHKQASLQFETRNVKKIYHGIVHGIPTPLQGIIDQPIAESATEKNKMIIHQKFGKKSITHYHTLQEFKNYAYVEFNIQTGRTHQIRVHMQYLGNAIVCDELYGSMQPILVSSLKKRYKLSQHDEAEIPLLNRLALHASSITFTASKEEKISAEAPLFKDMKATLQQFRKHLSV